MKTILVVDDHEIVRDGIKMIIGGFNEQYHFMEASTCNEVQQLLKMEPIHYIILDLFLPDGNAFTLIDAIVDHYPETAILIYTMNSEKVYGKRLIRKGVRGFVSKRASISDLEDAIHSFLNGKTYLSTQLEKDISDSNAEENPIDLLSDRELEVIEYLVMGMTTKEISYKLNVNSTTVSTFRRRAMEKLGAENNADLKDKFSLFKTEL